MKMKWNEFAAKQFSSTNYSIQMYFVWFFFFVSLINMCKYVQVEETFQLLKSKKFVVIDHFSIHSYILFK